MINFKHFPVLLKEAVDGLGVKDGGVYMDATLGGAGYTKDIFGRAEKVTVIANDLDPAALANAKLVLEGMGKVIYSKNNFSEIREILDINNLEYIDGIVADLGFSSYQLDDSGRGFSFNGDSESLDMRLSDFGQSAAEFLNTAGENEILLAIKEYGEENFAKSIAASVVKVRKEHLLRTVEDLKSAIALGVPKSVHYKIFDIYRRVFQGIRIRVNNELGSLEKLIDDGIDCLKVGGRMSIVTFHSLEDRIVKKRFERYAKECECPVGFPKCVCGANPKIKIITKKPIYPSEEELNLNSRSNSAKLRVAERI